jgi:hypothetical protein
MVCEWVADMIIWDDILKGVFGDKGLSGTVVDVLKDTGILKDPEQQLKIQQALQDYEVKMADIASKQIESVNATMREEAKSEHWIQYSWRPTIGFTFAAVIINNYILLPYFKAFGLQSIIIPAEMWTAILVILGAAAATRGWEKVTEAGKK